MPDKSAIESLKQRLLRDPLSRAFLQLAEEYRKAGLFSEAIRTCMEGLERHPHDHTARIALGRTYHRNSWPIKLIRAASPYRV